MPESLPQTPMTWASMTDTQREYLREVYIASGDMSLMALCRRYNIQAEYEAVKIYAYRHKWKLERDKLQAELHGHDEDARQQDILADVRLVLSSAMRKMCLWYAEKLSAHEYHDTVNNFPLDEWAAKIEKFASLIDRMAKLRGVTKEALAINLTQQNLNVNMGGEKGDDDQGPPGFRLDPDRMKSVVADLLAHVTEQTKPIDPVIPTEIVQPDEVAGAR